MITIFRRIRQRLIDSGSTSKYLLYAMGEIMLVVVGILIALQVNNWNENRKAKDYEHKVLMELRNAAQSDIDHIQGHLIDNRGKQKERAHNYFDRVIMGEQVSEDSLNMYYERLLFGDSFQFNKGPYESIKSSGLDKISNDSLRSQIATTYDFRLPRLEELIEWRFNKFEEEITEYTNALTDEPIAVIMDNEVTIRRPLKRIDFSSNQNFLILLYEAKSAYNWNLTNYQSVVAELDDIISKIDEVLEDQ